MRSIVEGVDKHVHVPKEKFIAAPPFPDSIKIEITSKCNYRCPYCLSWKSPRKTGHMDKQFLFRILKEAKSIGVREVGLFLLGEPFLVKELAEYIRYAKEEVKIEYVFITTNGSLCSLKRLREVIDAGLDSLKFSINAGNKETYKKMHGVNKFDTVINNIKCLYEYKKNNQLTKPRTCISSIWTDSLKEELENLKTTMSPFVDEFYYLPLYNQAGHIKGKEYAKIIGNIGRLENPVEPIPCWGLFNSAKISWNGYLTCCCFDHDGKSIIADLNKTSLIEAWHDSKFIELRKKHLDNNGLENSVCADCLGLK